VTSCPCGLRTSERAEFTREVLGAFLGGLKLNAAGVWGVRLPGVVDGLPCTAQGLIRPRLGLADNWAVGTPSMRTRFGHRSDRQLHRNGQVRAYFRLCSVKFSEALGGSRLPNSSQPTVGAGRPGHDVPSHRIPVRHLLVSGVTRGEPIEPPGLGATLASRGRGGSSPCFSRSAALGLCHPLMLAACQVRLCDARVELRNPGDESGHIDHRPSGVASGCGSPVRAVSAATPSDTQSPRRPWSVARRRGC
jgi:hypothetical protein